MADYYFTFRQSDTENAGKYVKITAQNAYEARDEMVRRHGTSWAMCYSENEWFTYPDDKWWPYICRLHNINPKRNEPVSQAEIYGLEQIE